MELFENLRLMNILFGIISIGGLLFLIYPRFKAIMATFEGGKKGLIYYELHTIISNNKMKIDYNPFVLLNKYLNEPQILPEKSDHNIWDKHKKFWIQTFEQFPNELIKKLENKINISKDIVYFEELLYTNHPLANNYLSPKQKAEIFEKVKSKGKEWAEYGGGNRENAVRLGYFALNGGLIELTHIQKENLRIWNQALELVGKDCLTAIVLLGNPLDKGANRSIESINTDIEEIKEFFKQIHWQNGVDLVDKLKIDNNWKD